MRKHIQEKPEETSRHLPKTASYPSKASRHLLVPSLKVRLRWLGAVLQYPCKIEVVVSSFNIQIRVIHH